ncbi:MAG: hypothetical protein ACUVXG_15310 [Anaerolineae bacterium]
MKPTVTANPTSSRVRMATSSPFTSLSALTAGGEDGALKFLQFDTTFGYPADHLLPVHNQETWG